MKRTIPFVLILGCLFATDVFGVLLTEVRYQVDDLGSGQWQYTYDVTNINLTEGIKEFTIWFDYDLYANLAIGTLDPPAGNWSEIVWQPEPVLEDPGGYDALAKNLDIGVGEHVYGFVVSFDWLGEGLPDSQSYEIINPVTFETIDSGYTIPEPSTTILMVLGGIIFLKKKKNI
jgi:hypothetical protein